MKIEKYVDGIIKKAGLSKKDSIEYKIQFVDHINSLKDDYISTGLSEVVATELAIKDFGKQSSISNYIAYNLKLKIIPQNILIFILSICSLILFTRYFNFALDEKSNFNHHLILSPLPFRTFKRIFHTIYFSGMDVMTSEKILNNTILFTPFGFIIPFFRDKVKPLKSNLIIFLCLIFTCHIIKFFLIDTPFNTDYLIMNFIGMMLGYGLYKLIFRVLPLRRIFFYNSDC